VPAGDRIVNQGVVNMQDPVGDPLHHQGLAQSSSVRQPLQIRMEFCRPTTKHEPTSRLKPSLAIPIPLLSPCSASSAVPIVLAGARAGNEAGTTYPPLTWTVDRRRRSHDKKPPRAPKRAPAIPENASANVSQ
jgi:hypothetical protein